MKISKFVRVDKSILFEYIYDDSNLISEPYSILFNSNTGVNSFISTLPKTKNYISTKNVLVNNVVTEKQFTNQLVKLDSIQSQYGRLSLDTYSFIQKKDFGVSIPIRYDKLKIHFPTNYIFDNYKGLHIRIYTLDYDNTNFVDLSNYFFNISDIDQISEMEYSSPFLFYQEMPWGKYIDIQFPSITKLADQRVLDITKDNTINYNLTNGVGLSKNAPIFIDFSFIENVQNVNNNTFFSLSSKKTVSFPQTPEFEKFGVVIEPSTQGDFFLIYPVLNGSIGEFNQYIQNSVILGNRYYMEYEIDVYEKNIKTSSQKHIVTNDFIEEIEFRPILKYSTTTAIIDVSCNLIDSADGSILNRKASYGFLQDEVSKYSRYLSKINLTKIQKTDVIKIKGILSPNLDVNNDFSINSTLKVNKNPFIVYSQVYDIVLDNTNANYKNKVWYGNRQMTFSLFPFDNVIKFNIISIDSLSQYKPSDLTVYANLKLVMRGDNKNISIDMYQASDENNLDFGSIVFKITEDKYLDIKNLYLSGFNSFYIIGSINNNKSIVYTGFLIPWNVSSNITNINNEFNINKNENVVESKSPNTDELQKIENVKSNIELKLNIPTSTNTTGIKNSNTNVGESLKNISDEIYTMWVPYWQGSFDLMIKSFDYQFNNQSDYINSYQFPTDLRAFAISLNEHGIVPGIEVDKDTGSLSTNTQSLIDLILGYFKIYNFNPLDVDVLSYISNNSLDLDNYLKEISGKAKPQSQVTKGANIPPNKNVYNMIKKYIILKSSGVK